ncbi:uncharacterized protein LOC143896497 [Temnothorax americanus]|uniref:uncharacterized protein LOC143896497 n=1 Tax=Temnothorax americanus TaxID=1964332 RepID=UPI004068748B
MNWPHLKDLTLADQDFAGSAPIDVLIGAELFGSLILDGVRKGAANEPIAQNTVLGWIISGPTGGARSSQRIDVHQASVDEDLDFNIRRFWEVEEIPRTSQLTPEDQACEEHFLRTHYRNLDGRYVVRLPFKKGPPISIGESSRSALQSYLRAENRLKREPAKAAEYHDFLKEYADLEHMQLVPDNEESTDPTQIVYIPHHAVFREGSTTTRIRVVFNASSPTTNGTSLNDHLLVGPKLQTNLAAVTLQWRLYRYVYSADVTKMYRQILVNPLDCDYQRIFWRPDPDSPVLAYRLGTVTYGIAAAPFLALKVTLQLVVDHGAAFPLAVPVLQRKRYIDDFTFGADDQTLARQTRDQVVAIMAKGGFTLRKWASNSSDLLDDIDPADHGLAQARELREDERIKILGLSWNPNRDVFQFQVKGSPTLGETKRKILSEIAKLFDPLGWATPVVIRAKIFMQQLWASKCSWDEPVPSDLFTQWRRYYEQLPELEKITIPRWTQYGPHTLDQALHGFSDASTTAYAAVVYMRTVSMDGTVTVTMLAAKSKVAPLKTMSVPRLELCASQLLARLLLFVCRLLDMPYTPTYCWTDSQVVLAWLSRSPACCKTFVANRVADIQTSLPNTSWSHVSSDENPADCASRGISPAELAANYLWWSGPSWLIQPPEQWPKDVLPEATKTTLEERPSTSTAHTTTVTPSWDLSKRYSSWSKLLRVTAYIQRFVRNIRSQQQDPFVISPPSIALLPVKVEFAENFWLQSIQADLFLNEITSLTNAVPIPKSSSLLPLNPFLDNQKLIRVGGRLRNANISETTRHPIVLRDHPLVRLLIRDTHVRALHAGSQLTLALLRQKYWILRARSLVRAVLYKCVICTRELAPIPSELMGDLPGVRVNRSVRAFVHTGVDYAGPVSVRTAKGRGNKAHKAYISVFICMTTRAIHLELVSDYSSPAFLAALSRFVSRRGRPTSIYSDNGTTFQGADRELTTAIKLTTKDPNFLNHLATEGTAWHFLPPSAPHFGGLWEAAVRSVKYHLKRCVGSYTLTFEELATVLCRIEACLNSRPIAAVSENLDDYQVLTPGHFLIEGPLMAVPEPSVLEINETRLSRWQLLQRNTEQFWKSWSNDYLLNLQQRPKWRVVHKLAKVGQMVLLRNALAPPCQWELGRITACHPGDDGLTRVVTIQTARSQYKRPITKLCFLPIDINSTQDSAMAGGVESEPCDTSGVEVTSATHCS